MRFLRWYARLTKKVLSHKPLPNTIKETFSSETLGREIYIVGNLVIWTVVNFVIFILALALWFSMPEATREFIGSNARICWAYFAAIVTAVWIFVKPLFDWLVGLDWIGIAYSINSAILWLIMILLHLIITIFIFSLMIPITLSVIDLTKVSMFGTSLQKENKITVVVSSIMGVAVGCYVTTSSYAVLAVNWAISFIAN